MKTRNYGIWWMMAIAGSIGILAATDPLSKASSQTSVQIQSNTAYSSRYGALLSTHFTTLEDLKSITEIRYRYDPLDTIKRGQGKPGVYITCRDGDRSVTSVLEAGISEDDFLKAKRGKLLDKIGIAMRSPFAATHLHALKCIENLGRRRPWDFGKGDVAFYDLAELMVAHICTEDSLRIPPIDLTEKGYLNTFNHITAQAFMTSMFSEKVADFVADVHERHNLPELITGRFSQTQLEDAAEGPVDNYVDMLNNEWGQELGLALAERYAINSDTYWTPQILAAYLNDIQAYYSWTLRIGFTPFRPTDETVIRFAGKINLLNDQDIVLP